MIKNIGWILFILSAVFILNSAITTGFVVNIDEMFSGSSILGMIAPVLFFVSLLMMTARQKLDGLIIFGNPKRGAVSKRARGAVEAREKYDVDVIVASGGKTPGLEEGYRHEAHLIYDELRKRGVPAGKIKIEHTAQNTLENIVQSLGRIKGNQIGVVSTPSHIKRIKYIFEKMREENPKYEEIKIHPIPVDEGNVERFYDFLAGVLDRYKLRHGTKGFERHNPYLKRMSNILSKWF